MSNNSYKESWYYKKHQKQIDIVLFGDNITAFWDNISANGNYHLSGEDSDDEFIFNWSKIQPHYNIPFDFEGCEKEIETMLKASILSRHDYVLLDTQFSDPIYKIRTDYFIENWNDFISANHGMGNIVCTEDYSLLMEFTNNHSYLLYSNFSI